MTKTRVQGCCPCQEQEQVACRNNPTTWTRRSAETAQNNWGRLRREMKLLQLVDKVWQDILMLIKHSQHCCCFPSSCSSSQQLPQDFSSQTIHISPPQQPSRKKTIKDLTIRSKYNTNLKAELPLGLWTRYQNYLLE